MSAEGQQKEIEERFHKILVADHTKSDGSRWAMMVAVLAVVTVIVFGTYYYVTKKKGSKDAKKVDTKEVLVSSARKSPDAGSEASKLVISGPN